MPITLQDIQDANTRIDPYIRRTDITQITMPQGGELFIKLENLQFTGSYKIRGAFNCLLQLSEAQRRAGVLTASAGNHAQGVARASRELGLDCTIVMPKTAPLSKISATERYGAHVELYGEVFDDACSRAFDIAEQTGKTYIHAFDNPHIIAGQGTIGLEIFEKMKPGLILAPIGGGGLISGIATVVKALDPTVRIIGVEPQNAASMAASIAARRIITLPSANTIADGIAVKSPGEHTYPICKDLLDEVVTVDEGEIASSILFLLEKGKIVSEGAGAAAVAAILSGKIKLDADRPTMAVLSGGNIDVTMVARIIDKGLIRSGRKCVIQTRISDKPGQLVRLLNIMSSTGANIFTVQHGRVNPNLNVTEISVSVELETRDRQHVFEITTLLEEAGYHMM